MAKRKTGPVSAEAVALGKRIKGRREQLGLSGAELGRRLRTAEGGPVARAQVWRWETGRDLPARSRWAELATALETTTEALFGGIFIVKPANEGTTAEELVRLSDKVTVLVRLLGMEEDVERELQRGSTSLNGSGEEETPDQRADRKEAQLETELGDATRRSGSKAPPGAKSGRGSGTR